MKKINVTNILIIICLTLIISLAGCESIKDNADNSVSTSSTISNTNKTSIPDTLDDHLIVIPTKLSTSPSGDNVKVIDYNQYLKKIWVVKSWDGGAYYGFSFFISKIENGVIEGKLSIDMVAEPDFYFYSSEPSKYLGDLSGTVNNGVAECQFSDKVGNKGNVTFVFKENDVIKAKMKYTEKGEYYKDLYLDENYIFRPYNLADTNDFIPSEEHSFAVNLNSWGNVYFVSGEIDHVDKVYSAAYLTNEHDDILYKFHAPFQTGLKIVETSIKDINNDELKDVMITTGYINDPNIDRMEWIFYQNDNGLFYDSNLDKK